MRAISKASPTQSEGDRLRALDDFQILDTPEEALYDAFTQLAAEIAGTPTSMISLVDETRQWFKSRVGMTARETEREIAFCSHVVQSGSPMVVEDATRDKRFQSNPLVTGDPNIRFYAGVPLKTADGHAIGTLCVIDYSPRTLEPGQQQALEALAGALVEALETRRRFLSLFDSARIDLFTIDPQSNTILFASRGACDRLGYTLKALAGKPVSEIAPDLNVAGINAMIEQARVGTNVTREIALFRRDGSSYPVEIRIDVTRDRNAERLIAIAIDVTERKSAQREIDLLLRAINVAGDVILVYQTDANNQLLLEYMNDAYTARTGYSRDEAIGKSVDVFRQAMPDDAGMRAVRAALAEGRPAEAELISYRKDGSTYWNQVSLYPIGEGKRISHWVSIERDITDEVNRTAVLEEEHDRLIALARSARRLFTALDARALVATVRNVVRELLGLNARVVTIRADAGAIDVEELGSAQGDALPNDALLQESVRRQARVVSTERDRAVAYAGRFADADHVLDIRSTSGHPLRATDLFVIDLIAEYFAVAARNVTLYHELDERRGAVLELSQTKSDLIAMLAHDFRGPLTTIVGFADLTGEVADVSEEQREFLDTIKRAALQLSDLATDTLTLSRLERNEVALTLGDIDLSELVSSIVSQYSDRRNVHLEIVGDTHVVGDDERLRQVFSNLIDNAIKYSPNGTTPEVSVYGEQGHVVVRVRDRGIGIPQAELGGVFDRFTRASNARKLRIQGTGFGLFLTKQLVQLHGGTIEVDSREGEGSLFTVTLPRRVTRASAPRAIVLLDPERDRSFLAYGLRDAGYRVTPVATLEEVLALADSQQIDAVIVNLSAADLPSERAVQLRAFSREKFVPIIAVADSATPLLSAATTLVRPVLVGDVIAALDRVIGPSAMPA